MMDEMKEIVVCKHCGNKEYYGMMHWNNRTTMCRRCIYDVWSQSGNWKPTEGDYVYPKYKDGNIYTGAIIKNC